MTDPSSSGARRFERVALGIIRRIDPVAEWTGRLCSWLIVVLIVAILYEVVSRYAFGKPTVWAYDVAWMTYGAMFMLCVGYTLHRRGHIRTPRWWRTMGGVSGAGFGADAATRGRQPQCRGWASTATKT